MASLRSNIYLQEQAVSTTSPVGSWPSYMARYLSQDGERLTRDGLELPSDKARAASSSLDMPAIPCQRRRRGKGISFCSAFVDANCEECNKPCPVNGKDIPQKLAPDI